MAVHLAREADLVGLAADGESLLDEMESALERDPSSFAKRAAEAFTALAAERFGDIKDPARRASAFRKLAPLQSQFEARAAEMQQNAEEVASAETVFTAAESVLAAARRNPHGKQSLFERLLDVAEQAPLTPDKKLDVKRALVARALREGHESMLGPRFDTLRAPARSLLRDIEREEQDAAPAQTRFVASPMLSSAETMAVPVIRAGADTAVVQGVAAPDTVDDLATRIGDRNKPAARQLARNALAILAGTGAASLSSAGGPIAALAAAFLVATTRPAGPGTQTLQHSLDDGRTFRFTFNPTEATGRLSVTAPGGDNVSFTLQRSPQGSLVFTDAFLSGDATPGRTLPRDALAAIIDTVAPTFAERGVRIEIGGKGDDDTEDDRDSVVPGSREHRGDNKPPELVEDENGDNGGEPEDDAEDDDTEDDGRPDLGKPGSRRNPDGSPKSALEQLEQLEAAQRGNRDGIVSTGKSKQNMGKFFDELKRR